MTRADELSATPGGLLRRSELADLRDRGRVARRETGSALFAEGDRAGWVAYLLEGHAKISRVGPDGTETILAVRGPGTFVGEMSAIDNRPRVATVTALGAFEALVVEAAVFRMFLRSHPRVAVELLRLLSRRLRESDRLRTRMSKVATHELVARQLYELAEQFAGTEAAGEVVVPLQQSELAGLVGASREAVNRALGNLRRRGFVDTRRGAIHVADVAGLARLVD